MRKALALAAVGLLAVAACNRKPAQSPQPPAVPGSAPTSHASTPEKVSHLRSVMSDRAG